MSVIRIKATTREMLARAGDCVRALAILAMWLWMGAGFSQQVAAASQSPEIQKGVAWLQAQVQADGSLAGEGASIALPIQCRSETALTLAQLAAVPPQLVAAIVGDDDGTTESLARQAIASSVGGITSAVYHEELLRLQNTDGGFGGAIGYRSNSLDTALALSALNFRQSFVVPTERIWAALSWMSQSRITGGGWGVQDQPRMSVTALALLAAQDWHAAYPVGDVTVAARDWLLAARSNGTYETPLEDALGLIALVTQTTDSTILQPLVEALVARQGSDGSWDGDPFVTALALRALSSAANLPPPSMTGGVTGALIDDVSGTPVVGAAAYLVQLPDSSTGSGADGRFTLSGLPPGSYQLVVAKVGSEGLSTTVEVTAGQIVDLGVIRLRPATLTATVFGTVRNASGTGLAGVFIGVGTASALTNSKGEYVLPGVSPGVASISASLTGYLQSVTAPVTFEAGQNYNFSPTLYTGTASATSLRGKVINGATSVAIAGASVTYGAQTVQTAADGTFTFSTGVSAGSFSLSIGAVGYTGATASGVLVSGVNNIGNLALTRLAATSTLSGRVFDSLTGAGVAGATVAAAGISSVSVADGSYVLAGIPAATFDLTASAANYLMATRHVALSQPGTAVLDIGMTKIQPSAGIAIDSVTPNQATYFPTDTLNVEVSLRNATSLAVDVIVDALVLDQFNNVVLELKANARGLGGNPPNLPITLPAATTTPVELNQLLLRTPAGTFTVLARAYDASGRAVAEGRGSFAVSALPVLSGGVLVDPPLMQVGTQTPVHFTAQLDNLGNQPISAGDLTLTVTLENPDLQGAVQSQINVRPLATGAPLKQLRGMATDDVGNVYTVSNASNDGRIFRIAPDGLVSVAAQVPIGAPDYPQLVAVARDVGGTFWVANANSGKVWSIDAQGRITKIVLTTLDGIAGIDVDAQGNLLVTGQKAGEHRLVRRNPTGGEAVLWANGLTSPMALVRDAAGDLVVTNNGDNTLVKVSAGGEIVPFVSGLNRPMGITVDTAGNYYVANNGDHTIVKISPAGVKSVYASGLNQPVDLRFDASGNLYVSCQGDDAIRRITPEGNVMVFARSVANTPQAMKYDAAGNLFIANNDGTLRELNTSGQAVELASDLSVPRGLAIDAGGNLLVSNYGTGTVARFNATGKSVLVSGLSQPWGIAVGTSGEFMVAEYGKNRLMRFAADGTGEESIDSLLHTPTVLTADVGGNVVASSDSFLTVVEAGGGRRFFTAFGLRLMTQDPAGGAVFGVSSSYDVYRVSYDGVATRLKTLPFYPYGIAADGVGNLYFADVSGRKIYRMDGAGNLTVLASPASSPKFMANDSIGRIYVLLADHVLYRVSAEGGLIPVSAFYQSPTYHLPSGLGMAADGRPLVWTNTQKVVAVNPSTGAQTILRSGVAPSGVTVDTVGGLHMTFAADHELVTYAGSGEEVARITGFDHPQDIVWDGNQFWFVDSGRTYRLAAGSGQYPVRQAKNRVASLAIGADGVPVGVNGGQVYRWGATGFAPVATIAGASDLTAIATRDDGALSVADNESSRVVTIGSNYAVLADYAGIDRPAGLAFDAAGRLHVAGNGSGTIARFEAGASANAVPTVFARTTTPGWLAFDGSGGLWVTAGAATKRVDADGSVTQMSGTPALAGVAWTPEGMFAVNMTGNQIVRWDASQWNAFASGLAKPEGVRALPDGTVAVVNRNNGTLVKWRDGALDLVASGFIFPHFVAVSPDNHLFAVGGDQGSLALVDAVGAVNSLGVANLLGSQGLYGAAFRPDGRLVVAGGPLDAVYEVSAIQPVQPPAPGTAVFQKVMSIAGIPVGESFVNVDFGTWVPPYGGDFRAQVGRTGVTGGASGSLHVGPFAQGVLAVGTPVVPPGTQTVPLQMKLTGADFSSVSRVETALVKPTVMGVRPNGMTADRAGNIYATDGTTLRKTTPAGVETILASGYTFGEGMAIDAGERLYVPVSVGGTYQLLRFARDGEATVLVGSLGAVPGGIAVNSFDEILVGLPGRLLKVTQDGVTSTYSTVGISSPVGIAIDGKDNVYVLNRSNLVTQLKPDGSAVALFSKGDGDEHPLFEYEGATMTADCGENIFLTPLQWSKVNQSGEEHTLVQVTPRTGHAEVVLDGHKIHYDLGDMDYIVFDRFGSRILIWTDHSAGRIWQVPVTCGAIGVEAHLVTRPGQTLAGMNRAPSAAVGLANGGTEYVWSLRDVTAEGVTFGFDTVLENLALGETRPVVDKAFLLFKNSFSPTDVQFALNIPSIQAENLISIGVGTDQPLYAANASAMVTTQLNNARPAEVAGTLVVDVFDASGVRVGGVIRQGVVIPGGETIDVPGSFLVGTIVPGTYTVRASLENQGVLLAQAEASFKVSGDGEGGTGSATTQLLLDRASYGASDRMTVTSRVTNTSANVILGGLVLRVAVADPGGTIVFSRDIPVVQLLAGVTAEFVSQFAFVEADAGTYTVTQTLADGTGIILATAVKAFDVTSSADTGAGLSGTLAATPKSIHSGDPVIFTYTLSNQGNAALAGLPLILRVVSPATGALVAEFRTTTTLDKGASLATTQTWTAQGAAGDVLVAVLAAVVGGKEITLAQDTLAVLARSVVLDISQELFADARVLALAGCGKAVDTADTSGLAACVAAHATELDAVLSVAGVAHRVTTDPEVFREALRSGAYNTYWLSARLPKLHADLAEEIREAVFRGDGYLIDGAHDERNNALDEIAGVRYLGKLGAERPVVTLRGQIFDAATLAAAGRATRVALAGGTQEATVPGDVGTEVLPAIVSRRYGNGRALFFGFDLVASARMDAAWADVVDTGLVFMTLEQGEGSFVAGSVVPLRTTVKNLGVAADVEVRVTLPAGAAYLESQPQAIVSGTQATWSFRLEQEASKVFELLFVAPPNAGSYSLATTVSVVEQGVPKPYGETRLESFEIRTGTQYLADARTQLGALTLVTNEDRRARDAALAKIAVVEDELGGARFDSAIHELVLAIDEVRKIVGYDVSAIRRELDAMLQESEWRWFEAQP